MQKSGEILHVAGSGRVIVRLIRTVSEGQVLCSKDGTGVAKVMEIIGPVREPYASAMPLTNTPEKHVGRAVFASTTQGVHPPTARTKKRSGKGRSK